MPQLRASASSPASSSSVLFAARVRVACIAHEMEVAAVAVPGMPVQRERIRTMAEILVAIGSGVDEASLVLIGRLGMASFAFDDVVDLADAEQGVSVAELLRRAERLSACAELAREDEPGLDPLERFMSRTAAALRARPAAAALWPDFVRAARRMFVGIVEHRVLGDRVWTDEPPALDELLRVGARSIGTELFSVGAWILLGSSSLAAVRQRMWLVNHRLARATRIANDLRTVDKDREERGANLTFLVDPSEVGSLEATIHHDLAEAEWLVEDLPASAQGAGRFALALAHHIVGVYEHRDFHVVAV